MRKISHLNVDDSYILPRTLGRAHLMASLPLTVIFVAACLSLGACATTQQSGPVQPQLENYVSRDDASRSAEPGKYTVLITKEHGRNVLLFPQGEPDAKTRKVAQQYADDLLHLKEGEQTSITMTIQPAK
ncbi:MAG TPA: hypothetical protein VHE61_08575 [Opitutaceae bacterium]|nr:hypothetical protein [Opitutaceae bacterium]